MSIILASSSIFRANLLKNAGLEFSTIKANIVERSVETPLIASKMSAIDIAEVLATTKAVNVSDANPDSLVIGCDQTLSFEGEMLHKPKNMDEARRRILAFSGKTHSLNSAIVLVRNSEVIWSHVEPCHIKFRELSPEFVGLHLARTGEKVLSSVGAYQIEGEGIQLFEKIEGDYFSITGLPLLQLLKQLRSLGYLES